MKYPEHTNVSKVQEFAKILLHAVEIEQVTIDGEISPFVIHPFTNSIIVGSKSGLLDLRNPDNLKIFYRNTENLIENITDVSHFYCIMGPAWYLTFFMYIQEFLSEEDFAKYFAYSWSYEENPNMDVNCSLKKSISFFQKGE